RPAAGNSENGGLQSIFKTRSNVAGQPDSSGPTFQSPTLERQQHLEDRSSRLALDRDRSAVAFDNRLHDRQSEPAAACDAFTRGVGLVEPIEDVRLVLGWNARTLVGNGDRDAAVSRPGGERDCRP